MDTESYKSGIRETSTSESIKSFLVSQRYQCSAENSCRISLGYHMNQWALLYSTFDCSMELNKVTFPDSKQNKTKQNSPLALKAIWPEKWEFQIGFLMSIKILNEPYPQNKGCSILFKDKVDLAHLSAFSVNVNFDKFYSVSRLPKKMKQCHLGNTLDTILLKRKDVVCLPGIWRFS